MLSRRRDKREPAPSGDNASWPPPTRPARVKRTPGGANTSNARASRRRGALHIAPGDRAGDRARRLRLAISTVGAPGVSRSRRDAGAMAVVLALLSTPSATQRSALRRSAMLCHRSSGFFARHLRTMDLSERRATARSVAIGAGSRSEWRRQDLLRRGFEFLLTGALL